MGDNVEISKGAGTVIAADEPSAGSAAGAKVQRVKPMTGKDGEAADVSSENPMPISGSVSLEPKATGGLTMGKVISAASTNATSLKASGGVLYGWHIYNAGAATRFVKLFNKAAAPEVGKDGPSITLAIPPGAVVSQAFPSGVAFPAGIAFAITKGMANLNSEAVGAEEVLFNVFYK